MVQDSHVDERKRISQPNRNGPVCCARFWVSAWVIVTEDYGRGIGSNGTPHYFPGVDRSAIDSSDGEPFYAEYAVSVVEPDCMELFVLQISEPRPKKVGRCLRVCEAPKPFEAAKQNPFCEAEDVRFGLRAGKRVVAEDVACMFHDAVSLRH